MIRGDYGLVVPVDALRWFAGDPGRPATFGDLHAALRLDLYSARKAVRLLRLAGLLERLGDGTREPPIYQVTTLAVTVLSLADRQSGTTVPEMSPALEWIVAQPRGGNPIASIGLDQAGRGRLSIHLALEVQRERALPSEIEVLAQELVSRQPPLPQLHLSLVRR